MKRLLGGVRQMWGSTGTVKKILSVAGVFSIAAFLVVSGPARPAAAAPDPANIPTSLKWVNRFYIVDNLGNYYKDSNTYDSKFEYQEEGTWPCKNNIVFTWKQNRAPNGDQQNFSFFYQVNGGVGAIPNSPVWDMHIDLGGKVTNPTGQTPCTWTSTTIPIDSNNDARRAVFYTSTTDQVISLYSNKVFSRKGSFQGSDRYFRDDEVADPNNDCPDMIIKHVANPASTAEVLFGKGDTPGSAMLYAVEKDANLNGISESYSWVSGAQNIGRSTCHIKADSINAKKNGAYGLAGYDDNGYDGRFEAAGLDQNGNVKPNGDEEDDSFIIFIGGPDNVKKDPTGNPVTTPVDDTGGDDGNKNDERACKVGALGWLVCPAIDAIQATVSGLSYTMQLFLTVNPLPIGTGPIYDSWNNIRNLSNIAFVIVFFAIIFSQATSIGISNYGIKRLLPRLVLIAIASNISYYICSIAIDLFNILGVGITSLFAQVNGGDAGGVTDVASAGLFSAGIAVALTWAIASGAIIEIFPLIIAAFVAFFVTFLALVLRQMLIIFLVIISPLAFVAGLLPGTQRWFTRWFDMFSTLLVMYPLIMGLFAAARLANSILSSLAGS